MKRIIIYFSAAIIFTGMLTGCHYSTISPDGSGGTGNAASIAEGNIDVQVITESGNNIAYHGEELLISVNPDKIIEPVLIEIIDNEDTTTVLAEDFSGPFPFSWHIPENFPAGECYRILINNEYYKHDSDSWGSSSDFAIIPVTDSGLSDITVSSNTIGINLIDNGAVIDGDTVSISLNGDIIVANHILTGNPGTQMILNLQDGINTLSITAVNEGSVSPNTAEITFTDVTEGETVQEWRLNAGETGSLIIRVE